MKSKGILITSLLLFSAGIYLIFFFSPFDFENKLYPLKVTLLLLAFVLIIMNLILISVLISLNKKISIIAKGLTLLSSLLLCIPIFLGCIVTSFYAYLFSYSPFLSNGAFPYEEYEIKSLNPKKKNCYLVKKRNFDFGASSSGSHSLNYICKIGGPFIIHLNESRIDDINTWIRQKGKDESMIKQIFWHEDNAISIVLDNGREKTFD